MTSRTKSGGVIFAVLLCIISAMAGVYFLSMLFTYFNTGADTADIYHADAVYFDKAKPAVSWTSDDLNVEGEINPYVRKDIENAYAQSMRALNLSQSLDENIALKEHFTVPLLKKIKSQLDTTHLLDYTKVNLSHTLQLHFISLDKSVVSFTDVSSIVKKKINEEYIDVLEAYHVNMTLVDGRWRIDALENTAPIEVEQERNIPKVNQEIISQVGINYYPTATPWRTFWTEYEQDTIEEDFVLIEELGFNNVRFFIPFEVFGGGVIDLTMIEKMDHLVQTAALNKINLIPTLFDFPIGYELDKYPMYDRQLEFLLKRYDKAESIVLWDLKNEPNLDFEYLGKEPTMQWLAFIIDRARTYSSKPITLGWSDAQYADIFCDQLDVISFHFYKDPSDLSDLINAVKDACTKPIIVSEYGLSTYSGIWPGGFSEEEQYAYHKEVYDVLRTSGVGVMPWCLYDYEVSPSSVFGWKPWVKAKQKNFGVLTTNAQPKKVMDVYYR